MNSDQSFFRCIKVVEFIQCLLLYLTFLKTDEIQWEKVLLDHMTQCMLWGCYQSSRQIGGIWYLSWNNRPTVNYRWSSCLFILFFTLLFQSTNLSITIINDKCKKRGEIYCNFEHIQYFYVALINWEEINILYKNILWQIVFGLFPQNWNEGHFNHTMWFLHVPSEACAACAVGASCGIHHVWAQTILIICDRP